MPIITLETRIKASKEVVFDLARSIDLHQLSTAKTKEEAIAGRTTGLMELGEEVTWRAKHFGIYQRLTSKMTELEMHGHFVDEMTKGIFKGFRHEHQFKVVGDETIMIDIFDYTSPLGILGKTADKLFLEKYMTRFLKERNAVIKLYAEKDS
ncbi:MAG: cell division protein [Crocinitomix sp.]|nr:cell division protein [Crocinitomix sp.]